jgi:hypothetical protein
VIGESSRITEADSTTASVWLTSVTLSVRPFAFAELGARVTNLFDARSAHPAGLELR